MKNLTTNQIIILLSIAENNYNNILPKEHHDTYKQYVADVALLVNHELIDWGKEHRYILRAEGQAIIDQINKVAVVPPYCEECGKVMDETEHNYGTEEMLCCIHCYNDAQAGTERDSEAEFYKANTTYLERDSDNGND